MKLKKTKIIEYTWLIYLICVLAFSSAPYFQMISIAVIPLLTILFITGTKVRWSSCMVGSYYLGRRI